MGEGIKLLVVKHEEAKWGWYRYPEGGGWTRRVRLCGASPRRHGSGDWSKTYECIPEVLLGLRFFAFAIVLLKRLAPALGILGGA